MSGVLYRRKLSGTAGQIKRLPVSREILGRVFLIGRTGPGGALAAKKAKLGLGAGFVRRRRKRVEKKYG
jgi:hypothetical protein